MISDVNIFKYEIDSIVVRIEIYPMFIVDVYCSQLLHYALCSPLKVSFFILLTFDGLVPPPPAPPSPQTPASPSAPRAARHLVCTTSWLAPFQSPPANITSIKIKFELQRIVTMFYPQVMAIVKIAGKGKFHN